MTAARAAVVALVAGMATQAVAQPCGSDLGADARRLEGVRYAVAFALRPDPVAVGEHFAVEFVVCPRDGAPMPASVAIDATMPEHRHGMNYAPSVVAVAAPGRYRATGLMFHMRGRWELTFDVRAASGAERLASPLSIE